MVPWWLPRCWQKGTAQGWLWLAQREISAGSQTLAHQFGPAWAESKVCACVCECVWEWVEATAVSHDTQNIDLISNDPPRWLKSQTNLSFFCAGGGGGAAGGLLVVAAGRAGRGWGRRGGGQCFVSKSKIVTWRTACVGGVGRPAQGGWWKQLAQWQIIALCHQNRPPCQNQLYEWRRGRGGSRRGNQ